MTEVVDRRSESGKSSTSRQRFLDRQKKHIKKAIDKAFSKGNVTDVGKGGIDVTVPPEDLKEPTFHHGNGGLRKRVHPGNKEFQAKDRMKRPPGGKGGGGKAGDSGDGEDDFTFHLSEEEFLKYLFEDLELPNLKKLGEMDSKQTKPKRDGFSSQGTDDRRNFPQSKKKRMGRLVAAENPHKAEIIALLTEEKTILQTYNETSADSIDLRETTEWQPKKIVIEKLQNEVASLKAAFGSVVSPEDQVRIDEIDEKIENCKYGLNRIPSWVESTDFRFNRTARVPKPTTKAVMVCEMDVSGSMTEDRKDKAKRFYVLLHRFLKKYYEQVDVVFIRHHTQAAEVDEQEFFYGRESGGTMVSSGHQLVLDTIQSRYPVNDWNIYVAQASDGDNWNNDSVKVVEQMRELLPKLQGFFYVEITEGEHQELWDAYKALQPEFSDKFWMGHIVEQSDVIKVFLDFFRKKSAEGPVPQSKSSAFAMAQP